MCSAPVLDKERAAANAARYAAIVQEVEAFVAHVTTKSSPTYLQKAQNTLQSILMPTKRARFVQSNTSSNDTGSTVSVGSAIDHTAKIAAADAPILNLDDYATSA